MRTLPPSANFAAWFPPLLPILLLMRATEASRAFVPGMVAVTTPNSLAEAREPQIAVAENGTIYIAFGAGDAVYCSVSRDGGGTFAAPVKVAETGKLALGMRRGPRIALAGKTVVISAVYGQQGKGQDGALFAWHSNDGGKTWGGPARVSDAPGAAREGLQAMSASPDGKIVACAWLDLRAKGTQIYSSLSHDGGMTWGKNLRIYASPDGTVCECCHPSLAFDAKGGLFVMWRNALGGARDMFLARSHDNGVTFGPAEKLGVGTWPLNACPMDGGALAAARNNAITTFWRRDQQIFLCTPGGTERLIGRGQQGWAASGPGGVTLVWLEGRPGRVRAMLPGAGADQQLADLGNDPVVAAPASGNGPVVAAWTSRTKGTEGIRSRVLIPQTGTVK